MIADDILPSSRLPARVWSMRIVVLQLVLGCALLLILLTGASAQDAAKASVAVGPQYDTTHVYVGSAGDMDALVTSFVATFGGSIGKRGVADVTPLPSSALSQVVLTPVGPLSVFAFQTPVPYPFGEERTGYLVTDMDAAVKAARTAGAAVIVTPFKDPIGVDAVVEWPGGVKMQLYWHFKQSINAPLETIPENRVYVPAERADAFVLDWVEFAGGRVVEDLKTADGKEIGRAGETYRRIRITSGFGKMQVLVTDGHLPYPFGREVTGYEVRDLGETVKKAEAAGVKVLVGPYLSGGWASAIVEFPGGYVAEVHSAAAAH
jgi:predicted enzyme related to lactoylglutathione lyase